MFAEENPTHTLALTKRNFFSPFIKVITFNRYLLVRPELSFIWQ